MLGTNGGGFFNANSAHPFENPTPLTNFVQMLLIFAIGAALTNVFGRMVGDQRQGWAIFGRDGRAVPRRRRSSPTGPRPPATRRSPRSASTRRRRLQAGGNMEGKEVRFGIANSALFAAITTAASCGAVNSMHDSFTPLGGHDPAGQHAARRDHLRRRRRRPLRHAAVRHPRGVHRRPDGRPHAGVSRQEDRGQGGQDDHAGHPGPAAGHPRLHRARRGAAGRAWPGLPNAGPARLQRDPLRLHLGAPATTAAPSPASPPTRRSTTRRSASRC